MTQNIFFIYIAATDFSIAYRLGHSDEAFQYARDPMVSGPISYLHNMFDYSKLGPQFSHVVSALKISDKHSKYKGEYDFNMTADEQRGQAAHIGDKNCGRN